MNLSGITWSGPTIDDSALLAELPGELAALLQHTNGFILHQGALHFRGACQAPEWHSLRAAWKGENSFQKLYPNLTPADIPFAQDPFGDQFLWRNGEIIKLQAETGDIDSGSPNLNAFLTAVEKDIQGFLNVSLNFTLPPGQLFLAYPPFCTSGSGSGASLGQVDALEVISFHANLANQIRDVPDGGLIEFKLI